MVKSRKKSFGIMENFSKDYTGKLSDFPICMDEKSEHCPGRIKLLLTAILSLFLLDVSLKDTTSSSFLELAVIMSF